MPKRRKGRKVTGILLLDKPAGHTSNDALQRVKRLFGARKAGHTGSLDPLATGLLPICFGDATKVSGFLLDADKHYQVTCKLGVATDTGDAEGEITEQVGIPDLDESSVEAALAGFRGCIEQLPPMYSAIKHQGQRLYNLARQGVEVERDLREVEIHQLLLEDLREGELDLRVHCSKGTYIRTLAEDIARALGTVGHVIALRRDGLGPYRQPQLWTIEQLESCAERGRDALDATLEPMDTALEQYPAIELAADLAFFVSQGQPVFVPKAPSEGWVRLYDAKRKFLGMGQILDDGRVGPKRLIAKAA
ncbi:tRNA pseudouridine(55) synthase TruB [Halorhodospira halochloris]|uniref:tRNA pseudouridine(55) synthase TruB n=1 Tax=Halorhodospira halochloris TaxID=1052 RepID=UPI001EE84136|nr:tRNA pseudouridine(55) synthase TruB [Halorhodospira halochloris]MCG5530628.1 tRNA pseudouridine(55) synthase TruB [Halorhodospira halochloris]MCG5548692.1 tRNA pseudouridine(55) synthase TruB [Halorhodospira halochloris]